MLQDFLKSFESTDLSKISLKELVQLNKTLSFYEATTPLRFYRNKINKEYLRRAKKIHNLREQVHEINTGYKTEDWECGGLTPEQKVKIRKRQKNGWDENYGWKFHLDVIPNRNHPVTHEISNFLIELGVWHKIAHGGDNGKGMTVYVGSYNDTIKLANMIHEKFWSKIYTPPVYTDQIGTEYAFAPTVYGRFCMDNFGKTPYQEIVGISPWSLSVTDNVDITYARAVSLGEVSKHHFLENASNKNNLQSETDKILAVYCSHKLCAKVWGKFYYGNSLKDFEDKFFGNKIPTIGTQKRKNWDEIANVFIEDIKRKRKDNNFDVLGEDAKKYIPIDFSSIKFVDNIGSKRKQNKQTPDYKDMASGIISKMKREI